MDDYIEEKFRSEMRRADEFLVALVGEDGKSGFLGELEKILKTNTTKDLKWLKD